MTGIMNLQVKQGNRDQLIYGHKVSFEHRRVLEVILLCSAQMTLNIVIVKTQSLDMDMSRVLAQTMTQN
jgi:hypothetical protein